MVHYLDKIRVNISACILSSIWPVGTDMNLNVARCIPTILKMPLKIQYDSYFCASVDDNR